MHEQDGCSSRASRHSVKSLEDIGRHHRVQRIVILGHTGFIGSHLLVHLRRELPATEIIGRSAASVDLTRQEDVRFLADCFDEHTAVIMLAATKRQFGDNLDTYARNMQMVFNLCTLLRERPIARLIYFSSAAVYGEDVHNMAITEDTKVWPTSYYGAAKFASECLLRQAFNHSRGGSVLVLRPPLIYGSGDRGETYGPSGFVRAVIRGGKVTLWGDGGEIREFIFVEDVVNVVGRFIYNEVAGIVNLVSGQRYTFREALEIALALAPNTVEVGTRTRTKARVDNAFYNDRLLQVLPDITFTDLKRGMQRVFELDSIALKSVVSNQGSGSI
jgi:UDP-glucose 4-epimerase